MKKLLISVGLVATLLLSGCLSTSQKQAVVTDQVSAVYAVDGAYAGALAVGNSYAKLPFCAAGTTVSITNICADRATVIKLDALNAKAFAAVQTAKDLVKNNPVVDITSALSAAWVAVDAYNAAVSTVAPKKES